MAKELEHQRFQFYSRCVESLTEILPRDYHVPSLDQLSGRSHWYIFYTPLEDIYFEWDFHGHRFDHGSCFAVGLHFEKNNAEENRKLLAIFRSVKRRLEAALGQSVQFDDNWRRNETTWARLYVWRPEKKMTVELESWAVEKAAKLIQECEQELKKLKASQGQTPPPTPEAVDLAPPPPERVLTTIHRIIRDTELARRVKMLHDYECQICGHTIQLPDGTCYAEAHHVRPLGQPHNGPDLVQNILCVCPNHHAELDFGAIPITLSTLRVVPNHKVAAEFVDYHNQIIHPRQ